MFRKWEENDELNTISGEGAGVVHVHFWQVNEQVTQNDTVFPRVVNYLSCNW